MTTVEGNWQVVPGGWSIGVEFSFYFMFPVLACYVISLKRSLIFFASSLVVSFLAYFYGLQYYKNLYGEQAADNFLFFWLPNQLGVFALAFILYFVINSNNNLLIERFNKYIGHRLVFIFGVFLILIISQIGLNKHFSDSMPWLPAHYIISFIFFALILGLYKNNFSVCINVLFIRLGEVSFSAYVLHFAVIQLCKSYTHSMIAAEGWMSILYFSLFLPLVIVLTYLFSRLTYKMIELPSIAAGRKVSKNALFFINRRGFTNVN
jgi:peptidoglycan/LPS O-acetylase OafA/YrhL